MKTTSTGPQTARDRLFPARFTLLIEENPILGWVVTTDAHPGFLHVIHPEEGLPEGLRKVPASLRLLLVAQKDLELGQRETNDGQP